MTEISPSSLILEAIKINEAVVRSYETKAQIALASYLFLISALGAVGARGSNFKLLSLVAIIGILITVISLLLVVAPTRKTPDSRLILFPSVKFVQSLAESDIGSINSGAELLSELKAVVAVRDQKHNRFNRALVAYGLTSVVVTLDFLTGLI